MTLQFEHDVCLGPYNGMAIPARGQILVEVSTAQEIQAAIEFSSENSIPLLVLGEGSNTLFQSDFPGLIMLNRLTGIELLQESDEHVIVKAAAGENWHSFVEYCLNQGWYGLENLALIPGMVGAAPIQNIGAYGVELEDTLVELEYIDMRDSAIRVLNNQECQFGYRDSIFKHAFKDRTVITSITFKLNKQASCNISYPALAAELDGHPVDARRVFDAVCRIRSSKLPLPAEIPNTGSFFKNPVVSAEQHAELKKQHPELVSFAVDNGYKVAAGWLIEQAGWKNRNHHGVRVHREQALVIINPERRAGQDVVKFAAQIQTDIAEKFGVNLEIEPRVY